MAKVTRKLPTTVPRRLATAAGIRPGDERDRTLSDDSLPPVAERREALDRELRLRLFDAATRRQRRRQQAIEHAPARGDRGWSREELYDRDGAR